MVGAVITPIAKRSVEAQATDALRQSIVSGALPAGARLTEMRLASDFAISRATVRTALHQLTKEGIVVQTPYTGWAVVSLTATSAWELYTLRSALESLAAKLATERLDEDGKRKIENAFEALAAACGTGELALLANADFALHKTIVGLARHGRLASLYATVEDQVRMYISFSDALVRDTAEILDQHRPIVSNMLAGRSARAAKAAERHNLLEGKILLGALKIAGDTRERAST